MKLSKHSLNKKDFPVKIFAVSIILPCHSKADFFLILFCPNKASCLWANKKEQSELDIEIQFLRHSLLMNLLLVPKGTPAKCQLIRSISVENGLLE